MLYDMTTGALETVPVTTFKAEKVLERTHLQAAIRDRITLLGDDLLVVAEEFGEFEEANRRIDLLCVDRSARLVVVELKRTDSGGHMELQALRYAAMVSVMTFHELAQTFAKYLRSRGETDVHSEDARARLLDWFDELEDEDPIIPREVGIVLASADFSQEITTTVLWLNEFYGMDIRCVRLSPYRHHDRLLLDVQQVVPLPEAAELTVRLKKREAAAKSSKSGGSSKDLTKYLVRTPGASTGPLPKRRAVLAMARAVHEAGVSMADIAGVIAPSKLRSIPGHLEGDALWEAFATAHGQAIHRRGRWFTDSPFVEDDTSWLLSTAWGTRTAEVLEALADLAPAGYSWEPVE